MAARPRRNKNGRGPGAVDCTESPRPNALPKCSPALVLGDQLEQAEVIERDRNDFVVVEVRLKTGRCGSFCSSCSSSSFFSMFSFSRSARNFCSLSETVLRALSS